MDRLLRLSCSFLSLFRSVGGGGLAGGGGRAGGAARVGVRLFLGAATGAGVLPKCCPCRPVLAALGEGMGLTPADPGGRGAILFFLRAGRVTLGEGVLLE